MSNQFGWKKRLDVYRKTKGRCAYCGQPLADIGNWPIDHMKPRSQGGSSRIENLIAACPKCNRAKLNRDVETFRGYIYQTIGLHIHKAYKRLEALSDLMPEQDFYEIMQALIDIDVMLVTKAEQRRATFYIDQLANDNEAKDDQK